MKAGGRRTVAVLAGLVVTVALVASSCVLDGTWTVVGPPPPSSGAEAELVDVACPTRDFCMAVGLEWSDEPARPATTARRRVRLAGRELKGGRSIVVTGDPDDIERPAAPHSSVTVVALP
jgi:hypothetical protein